MKLARYMGGGEIAIVDEPIPTCPEGGLLVRTLASGLCSGELMDWYMDRKIPHVLGHEVCGEVVESQDRRFPVGMRVAPHHHAPCMSCDFCRRGAYVHCEQWKRTKLVPGGMAEYFAVARENLSDTIPAGNVAPRDAALVEPLACVCKSYRRAFASVSNPADASVAVIGLGFMGVMHLLLHRGADAGSTVGYDVNPSRLAWAGNLGFDVRKSANCEKAQVVFVCPGSEDAIRFASSLVEPDGVILLFSPLPPGGDLSIPINDLYFGDVSLIPSYSCGPNDTSDAIQLLADGHVRAEQVVSDFIALEELPSAYRAMKAGEILKPMVEFGP